jgi:hypothetical protein
MAQTHFNHRWTDVTTFADTERRVYCFDCGEVFADGPIRKVVDGALHSPAFQIEKMAPCA